MTFPYQVMVKPFGPICNMGCRYCFYLEKKNLYKNVPSFRMPYEVLESFIRQYVECQDVPEILFAWQGGEPTLMGIEFYQTVVALQKKYANGKKLSNTIQTNGILLNDAWCNFLSNNNFLVGVSIDGPAHLHDQYRRDKENKPSFERVINGLECLKRHGIPFNLLTVVNDQNSVHPLQTYKFLKEVGDGYIQFIPAVQQKNDASDMTSWSVTPKDFGEFYIQIFDEWIRQDVGTIFVQFFDVALGNWLGAGSTLCQFAPRCGNAAALEHNGDLYSCDHFVFPKNKLGNILQTPLQELMACDQQIDFGNIKSTTLTEYCKQCEMLFACHGDCPKHRLIRTPDGTPGLSYLCSAYQRIFKHISPYMTLMTKLLNSGRPAPEIMNIIRSKERHEDLAIVKRNDPCPCGSGKKYKKCCGSATAAIVL